MVEKWNKMGRQVEATLNAGLQEPEFWWSLVLQDNFEEYYFRMSWCPI